MNEIFNTAKREVLVFLISVIALSLLVALLANAIFEAFYKDNKAIFVCTVVSLVFVSAGMAFLLLASARSGSTNRVQLTFAFDRVGRKFVDIPNCWSSVHARMWFEKLEPKHKEYLSTLANIRKFHDSDFSSFIHEVVQEILLGLAVNDKRAVNMSTVSISELPAPLRKNKWIVRWLEPDGGINLPDGFAIAMTDSEGPYFSVISPHGTLKFRWTLVIGQMPHFTAGFLQTLGSNVKANCNDIWCEVEAEVKLNYWMMLAKGTKNFVVWAEGVVERLSAMDWSITEGKLPLVLMEEILKRLDSSSERAEIV